MNSILIKLPLILSGLMVSQSAISEINFSLPREKQGIEILLGAGAAYDKTAFIGDEDFLGFTPTVALMTENFYLDIHNISYKKSLNENLDVKIFGVQDAIPSEDDVKILNIKSGESFDIGISSEKKIGGVRVGGLVSADVTGTHGGYLFEATLGKDIKNKRSKLGFTLGGRYQDKKRNNYFYGVSNDEAYGNIPEYEVGGEWTAFTQANYSYQLTHNLGVIVDASLSTIGGQANKSPRIDKSAKLLEQEIFVGFVWQFSVYN